MRLLQSKPAVFWALMRRSALIALLVALVVWLGVTVIPQGFYDRISYVQFLDYAYQARGVRQASSAIVLVNLGSLPADREKLAHGIRLIRQCQPSVIGLDLLLDTIAHSHADSLLSKSIMGATPFVISVENLNVERPQLHAYFDHGNVFKGHAGLLVGRDNVVRRFRLTERVRGTETPTFASQIARQAGTLASESFDPYYNYLINYAGDQDQFLSLNLNDLVAASDGDQPLPSGLVSTFRGKIVLIGYVSDKTNPNPIYRDLFRTPIVSDTTLFTKGEMYGVVIHANILNTLLGGSGIREIGGWWTFTFAALLLFGNLFLRTTWRPMSRNFVWLPFLMCQGIALAFLPILVFNYFGIQVDVSIPLVSLILLFKAESWYYSFVDNAKLIYLRLKMALVPKFLREPFFGIYRASALDDRIAAALNTAVIIPPFVEFLTSMTSNRLFPKTLEATAEVEKVLARSQEAVGLHMHLRNKELQFVNDRVQRDETTMLNNAARTTTMTFKVVPIHSDRMTYDHFFLEIFGVVEKTLNALMRELKQTKGEWEITSSMSFHLKRSDGTSSELHPNVRQQTCCVHNKNELFVLRKPWQATNSVAPDAFIGPTPSCFFISTSKERGIAS